jgi:hypothetical protein
LRLVDRTPIVAATFFERGTTVHWNRASAGHWCRIAIVASAGIITLACGRGGDGSDSIPADSGGRLTQGAQTNCKVSSNASQPTPEMPAPIETISLECFNEYVGEGSLVFDDAKGKKNADRKCVPANTPDCQGANGIKVDIDPEVGAHLLGATGLGANGHIVARFKTKGNNKRESKYNLPGGDTLSYMLVTNGRARFVYATATEVVTVRTFTYRGCDDGNLPHPTPAREADFRPCLNKLTTETYDRDEPAWVSCVAGCCIAETQVES